MQDTVKIAERRKSHVWAWAFLVVVGAGALIHKDGHVWGELKESLGDTLSFTSSLLEEIEAAGDGSIPHGEIYTVLGGTPEASLQIENVAKYSQYPEISLDKFRRLLADGEYEQLDELFREQEMRVVKEPLAEISYATSLYELNAGEGISLANLNAWVDTTRSEFAYVARSAYYANAAYRARGKAFASETSDAQWKSFRRIATLAATDALAAKEKNGRSWGAYLTFYRLLGSGVEPIEKAQLIKITNDLFPWSYRLRWAAIEKLQPRWSGSYSQMDAYAQEMLAYLPQNSQLWLLQGASHGDKANRAHRKGDYRRCLDESNLALAYGVNSTWLRMRADCLEHLQEYELALRDIKMSLAINVNNQSLHTQNKIYKNMKK